jgi:hypothetical protein
VATLFSGDATLMSVEQWAMDLDYRRGERGLAVVRRSLDSMMPGVQFDRVDKRSRQLRFKTPDGKLPLSQLSDGYQSMAAWCGDILYRISETFADYINPLTARGILLLDEIDLHLHPLWQRQLVKFLAQTLPNFQIIATTHSPITAHQAGRGELFVLKRPSKSAAAELVSYEGAPNELLLQQIIQSPMFGVQTLDSVKVSELRDELRKLNDLPEVETADETSSSFAPSVSGEPVRSRHVANLEQRLQGLADMSTIPEYLRPTNQLLSELRIVLQTTGGAEARGEKRAAKKVSKSAHKHTTRKKAK